MVKHSQLQFQVMVNTSFFLLTLELVWTWCKITSFSSSWINKNCSLQNTKNAKSSIKFMDHVIKYNSLEIFWSKQNRGLKKLTINPPLSVINIKYTIRVTTLVYNCATWLVISSGQDWAWRSSRRVKGWANCKM